MNHLSTRRSRRAAGRARRAVIRTRAAANRLAASCRRHPRSIATHLLAAGVDRDAATGCASGLRAVAKRLNIEPVEVARTRRTVQGGRARRVHVVYHYTRTQVARIASAYRPKKSSYRAAIDRLALSLQGGLAVA
ncbi:hypothetical protein [Streptomyces sp. NPDC102437]|uniref:hypothetical protein n=1 Tax=Streptomyces sp. NPDC102437 TaxID=3366175 RepID=UPI0038070FF1